MKQSWWKTIAPIPQNCGSLKGFEIMAKIVKRKRKLRIEALVTLFFMFSIFLYLGCMTGLRSYKDIGNSGEGNVYLWSHCADRREGWDQGISGQCEDLGRRIIKGIKCGFVFFNNQGSSRFLFFHIMISSLREGAVGKNCNQKNKHTSYIDFYGSSMLIPIISAAY